MEIQISMDEADEKKINRLALLFCTMAVFLILFGAVIYRLIEINQVAKDVKYDYELILQNYSIFPSGMCEGLLNTYSNKGCIRHGYWFPECPNATEIEKDYIYNETDTMGLNWW